MQSITTIGFDIAKSVFQVHGIDAEGSVVAREEANLSWFELSGEVGDDQDSEHQKPQPLNEAAEVIADGGEHGVDGIAA